MRHETRIRLDALESAARRRRLKRLGLSIGAAVLSTLVSTLILIREPRSQLQLAATVRAAHVGNDNGSGQREMKIEAVLDDGTMVFAFGRPLNPPRTDERILLRQRKHWFGYHSYYWEGLRP